MISSRHARGVASRPLTGRAALLALLPCAAVLITGCGSTAPAAPAAAGAAGAASSPAAQAATPSPAGADTFLAGEQDVNDTALHAPACASGCVLSGDSTVILYGMTWSSWTGTTAAGAGTERIDDCEPNCAAGGQYRVAVTVTLSQPVRDCGPGGTRWFWSRASFAWPDGLPRELRGANAPANPWTFTALIGQARQSCA